MKKTYESVLSRCLISRERPCAACQEYARRAYEAAKRTLDAGVSS